MNEEEKRSYLERYKRAKEHGVPFFPDIVIKDAVVSLLLFLLLVALAYFVGAPLEARADPADTTYTPRPEWYFLFLFQLLKYFPGKLEVVGIVVIPTLVILLLFLLPFIDRSAKRHFSRRPLVTSITGAAVVAVVGLTLLAVRETPPPREEVGGDPIAALYSANCAGCHGPSIDVPTGTDLHAIISEGKHEGMPAWSADLTSDEIDALAGFILSPQGSALFAKTCGACHEAPDLVSRSPLELEQAIDEGPSFSAHEGVDVPQWSDRLTDKERIALLNFLAAPDGQRLFAINCAPCHGTAVSYSGDKEQLRSIIEAGGQHLEMPAWRGALSEEQLDTLAAYVVDPDSTPQGAQLFADNCSRCHGQTIPKAENIAQAKERIATGGMHETMPVWGEILTEAQIDALTDYTFEAARGTPLIRGRQLFEQNCATCHGDFGEGGPNPSLPGQIIVPISSAEFLSTRDDNTLRSIISHGQPTLGMSPFSTSFGGPLSEDDIDAIVAFVRSWEKNPPVELPPEIAAGPASSSGAQIFANVCARCHGPNGEGGIGPALRGETFRSRYNKATLFDTISLGHEATEMIPWGEVLTSDQINQLVAYIEQLEQVGTPQPGGTPTFAGDVQPIFLANCAACHGSFGGWDASSYDSALNSGDHAPVIIPGDPDGSLLIQKLRGTQTLGGSMPPSGPLSPEQIQILTDWVANGAPQ